MGFRIFRVKGYGSRVADLDARVWGTGVWGTGVWGTGVWGTGVWGTGVWGTGVWGQGFGDWAPRFTVKGLGFRM